MTSPDTESAVMRYIAGDDQSEVALLKAQLEYMGGCLNREIDLCQQAEAKCAALTKGLEAAFGALFESDEADAIDNLEGALIDIRRLSEQGKPTDQVCINTLGRIMEQLLKAHAELEAATSPFFGKGRSRSWLKS